MNQLSLVTSVRVASQLYTYVEGTIKEKFGSEVYIFGTPLAPLVSSKGDKVAKSVASKKEKSGPSTTVSSKKGKAAVIVETVEDVSGSNYSTYVFILTELTNSGFTFKNKICEV